VCNLVLGAKQTQGPTAHTSRTIEHRMQCMHNMTTTTNNPRHQCSSRVGNQLSPPSYFWAACDLPFSTYPTGCSHPSSLLCLPPRQIPMDKLPIHHHPVADITTHALNIYSLWPLNPDKIHPWMAPPPRLIPCPECICLTSMPILSQLQWNCTTFHSMPPH